MKDVMTEEELVEYLRIPEISRSKDPHNVIANLKRMRGLPTLHLCNKTLFPIEAVRDWVKQQTEMER